MEVRVVYVLLDRDSSLIDTAILAVFRRLFPVAKTRGLRLVAVNWRDYPGSTPYSPAELDAFGAAGSPEIQEAAMREEGFQLARFLESFIAKEKIPPIARDRDGKRTGGLSVMAWSLGNVNLLPLMANAYLLEGDTKALLQLYLRTFLHFGL